MPIKKVCSEITPTFFEKKIVSDNAVIKHQESIVNTTWTFLENAINSLRNMSLKKGTLGYN